MAYADSTEANPFEFMMNDPEQDRAMEQMRRQRLMQMMMDKMRGARRQVPGQGGVGIPGAGAAAGGAMGGLGGAGVGFLNLMSGPSRFSGAAMEQYIQMMQQQGLLGSAMGGNPLNFIGPPGPGKAAR